jgi:serine protease Do
MKNKALLGLGLLVTLGAFAGCQHGVAQAAGLSGSGAAPTSPAPFAAIPVLPGTPDVATIVARLRPAVVNITTVHEVHMRPTAERGIPFGFGPFQGRMPGMRSGRGEGEQGDPGERGEVMKERALGSGFIVESSGKVVTNAHVVEGADEVKVKLADDREFDAKVIGRDKRLDLAVLQLAGAKDLPVVALGASEGLRVGEYVVAIGNPFGLGDTVTMGIVSAKSRAIGAGPYDDFIQTDASINPGNSGGPLFNLHGQVVGINTAINPNGKGIGFAIPSDALRDVLPQLETTGHVARGRLGVAIQPVDAPLAKALGLDRAKGALVGDVEDNGPAAKVGMKSGDVILTVDGAEVSHAQDLPRIVARHAPGSTVKVTLMRDRAAKTLDVTLDALKEQATEGPLSTDEDDSSDSAQPSSPAPKHTPGLGLALGDAPNGGAEIRRVAPGSDAAEELQAGDVILEVNHAKVVSAEEAVARVKASTAGEPVLLKVRSRDGQRTRYVALERK